jgi:thiol:disulfide interchange protein DsbD
MRSARSGRALPDSRRRLSAVAVGVALLARAMAAGEDAPPIPSEIVRLKVESANFSASRDALEVVLGTDIAEGWHVNAHQPTSKELIPTTLSVVAPAGFEVGEIEYPHPESITLGFARGERLAVYSGHVRFRIPLTIETEFTRQGASFQAKLRYQACDDTRCLRPTEAERTFLIKRPADIEAAATPRQGNAAPVEQWLTRYGLLPTLAIVFVMGLGLNLTPCVYPLISVTVAYFGGQARERRRAVLLAGAYALGIALTFSALGVSAALSGGLFGRALQQPATLVAIALVMVALALSSFGLYSLQPPAWVLQKVGGSAGGLTGALFMGLTMGVVAAPCVGPIVVGLLVAVGARADAVLGFTLFFTLALGLGAPYVALGAAAGSIARLPRSGEWLVWIERLFGFILLGLSLYFVSPLLSSRTLRWSAAGLIGTAGLVLGFLDAHGANLPRFNRLKRGAGVLALLAALWIAGSWSGHSPTSAIAWMPFSPRVLEEARSKSRPAVVDFRADWCLPCIEMERTTFIAPEVNGKIGAFVMLRADVTEMSKDNESLLSQYGVLGVPTTIFFAPDGTERHRMVGYIGPEDFVKMLQETGSTATITAPRPTGAREPDAPS